MCTIFFIHTFVVYDKYLNFETNIYVVIIPFFSFLFQSFEKATFHGTFLAFISLMSTKVLQCNLEIWRHHIIIFPVDKSLQPLVTYLIANRYVLWFVMMYKLTFFWRDCSEKYYPPSVTSKHFFYAGIIVG